MSNLNPNKLNQVYAAADITLMKANATSTISKIPATATLTEEERSNGGLDMDVENKIFVEDTINELNSNGAAIMPTWFVTQNLVTDFTFFEQSDELRTIYTNVVTRLYDAQRVAGREAYAAALVAYDQYRIAAEAGVPGAQESYNKLRARFAKSGANKSPQENP